MKKFKGEIVLAVSGAVLILCAWVSYVSASWFPEATLSSPAIPFFLLAVTDDFWLMGLVLFVFGVGDDFPELVEVEVLGEAIQTVIRAEIVAGRSTISDPYAVLKELTRGRRIGRDDLRDLGRPS